MEKTTLRKIIKTQIAALSPEQFTAAGTAAAGQLPLLPHWDEFRSVLAFFSMKDEIDTRPIMEIIIKTGKSLFVPKIESKMLTFYRIDQNDLEHHTTTASNTTFGSGYREPKTDPNLILKPKNFPALVITPGLAFDRCRNRLGRGLGYYDRFFAALDLSGRNYTALGLCMPCQLAGKIPVDPWDKKMDALLTEALILDSDS